MHPGGPLLLPGQQGGQLEEGVTLPLQPGNPLHHRHPGHVQGAGAGAGAGAAPGCAEQYIGAAEEGGEGVLLIVEVEGAPHLPSQLLFTAAI